MATTRYSLRNAENANGANAKGLLTSKTGMTTRSALGDIANQRGFGRQNSKQFDGFKQPVKNLIRPKTVKQETKAKKTTKEILPEVKELPKAQDVSLMEVEEVDTDIKDVDMEEISSFSSLCLADVEDIDAEDEDNPQLVTGYVNEIYAYMRQLEKAQPIAEKYLESFIRKVAIKPKMRNLLVDWMVDVHQQFTLLLETLFLAVSILDRYLMVKADMVSTKKLQLVGVTSMLIAAKYEEMYPPELADFIYISDNAYTALDMRLMEVEIMSTLNFDLGRPLPLNFLRRNSRAGFVDSLTHGTAKYLMELSLVDYQMVHIPPSYLAAAALAFAMKVLDNEGRSLEELWTSTLRYYTSYALDELKTTISLLAKAVKVAHGLNASASSGKRLKAVTKKYSTKKFLKVSLLPCFNTDTEALDSLEG